MTEYRDLIASEVAAAGNSNAPLLVHADVFRARGAIVPVADAEALLERHMQSLEYISGQRPIYIPVFNYDFTSSRVYRPGADASQIGPLTEYARTDWADWRAGPPVYNFVGRGERLALPEDGCIDPFDKDSLFALLHGGRSSVLMYGARFSNFTSIHYIERLSGGPLYRYDKVFNGIIKHQGGEREVSLTLHCRPMGKALEYNWAALRQDAEQQGVLRILRGPGSEVVLVDLAGLCEFWLGKLKQDPLYLLNAESRDWVAPMLDKLGRRFELADFEQVA